MRLFVYMLVNVKVIYYVHVCEQAHWARTAGNSAIENLCIIIIIIKKKKKKEFFMLIYNEKLWPKEKLLVAART